MTNVKIVSGYIPISTVINYTEEQFRDLGNDLYRAIPCTKRFYDTGDEDKLYKTWMWKWVHSRPWQDDVSCSDPDPDPARFGADRFQTKLLSNYVMHQKYEWLAKAALEDPIPHAFCWIDYGVLKQEGMKSKVITEFCEKVMAGQPPEKIWAPGIRSTADEPDPAQSWDRFCGSVVLVPRPLLFQLAHMMKLDAMHTVTATKKVTIETNTLARVERMKPDWFNWQQAWWGRRMFDCYPDPIQTC